MALILLESFDGPNPNQKWTASGGTVNTSNGRSGKGWATDGAAWEYALSSADQDDVVVLGFAFKPSGSGSSGVLFTIFDTTNFYTNLQVSYNPGAGTLEVAAGNVVRFTTASGTVPSGAWSYIELKVRFSNTVGTLELRVNEDIAGSATGIDTVTGGAEVAGRLKLRASGYGSIDDIYFLNEQGSAHNDFLGDITVEAKKPNGNGNSSGMTGSDGNSTDNYALVSDNSDATYVEHATAGTKDTYAFENLTITDRPILGVQAWARALTDAGPKKLAIVGRSGASEADSADQTLTTSVANYKHTFATKPGGGAWTAGAFDAAEFGVKARD